VVPTVNGLCVGASWRVLVGAPARVPSPELAIGQGQDRLVNSSTSFITSRAFGSTTFEAADGEEPANGLKDASCLGEP
jgi:hypothetical protein